MPEHDGAGQPAAGRSVDWRRTTGVGCFGRPAILIQVLHRIMAQVGSAVERDNPIVDTAWLDGGAGPLIARLSRQLHSPAQPLPEGRPRVAGFFLYAKGGRLQIRVLTQYGWSLPPRR